MSDSFMHKHQAALDSQREEAAINWRFGDPTLNLQEDFWEDSDLITEYCQKCDCILRSDEGDICCSCEEIEDKDFPYEDDEPSDYEIMSSFGTKWHDQL